jgi:MYXO-CTERM domain-containing protein
LKFKHVLSFLALVLAVAAPAFADGIPASFGDAQGTLLYLRDLPVNAAWPDAPDIGFANIEDDRYHTHIDSRLFDFDSHFPASFDGYEEAFINYGNAGGFDDNCPVALVSTPEPASRTLLLFGLAGLALILFRRSALIADI